MAGAGSIIAGAAFVKLTMDNAELKKGLDAAQNNIQKFAASVNRFSSQMSLLGPIMATPMIAAARAFADFDDKMRLTAAVTGATGKQFEALTEQAKRLGRETSFTAAQVAEGMTSLGRMGFSPKEIEAAIQPMMNLAKATGTELSDAAQIAANNLRVFKMQTSQSAEAADILTVAANGSAQTLIDLGESLKMAGPHAARAGASLKETAGMLGVLANMGIRGSLAGTALGKSFKRMADPKVTEFLKQYGVETKTLGGELRNMQDILIDVAKAMKNMTGAEQINFAEEVFDARGSLGGGTLSVNTEAIDEMMQKLNECDGAAQRIADQMEAGLGGALRRLASAAEGVNIAFGEIIGVTFGPAIESVSSLCLVLRELIGANNEVVQGALAVVGAFVGFGMALKAVTMVYGAVKSIFAPLALLNQLVSGASRKAAEAVQAEQQKAAATETRIAREIAAEKLKTANELAEIAKRTAAEAREQAGKLNSLKAEKAQNDLAIADSARVIAAKKAETAAIIAEEQKVIAAQQGKRGRSAQQALAAAQAKIQVAQTECAATVTAETEKQAAIERTNLALSQQIAAQNGVAAVAAKSAMAAGSAAGKAGAEYSKAAAAAEAAAKAEAALAGAQKLNVNMSKIHGAALGKLSAAKLFGAACSRKHAKSVLTASISEMVAAKRGAGASALKTAGYYAEAVGAKVAAGATLGLKAALDLLMANPITIAFLAIAAAIWAISAAAKAASENLRAQAEASKRAADAATAKREKGDEKRQNAESEFKRLEQLEEISKRVGLSAAEMAEAEKLIHSLDPYGSANWAGLDKVTGQLTLAADAQKRFNDEMREAAKIELESEILKQQKAITDLQAVLDDINDEGSVVGIWTESGRLDKEKRFDEKLEEIKAEQMKLQALQKRLAALTTGDQAAVTGKDGEAGTSEKVEKTAEEKRAAAEKIAEAEKELARIDEENARKKLSQLETEINEIDKLKKKYMELADLKMKDLEANLREAEARMRENQKGENPAQVAAFNAAKEAADKARAEIADLKNRIDKANESFDRQRAEAEEKEQKRNEKYTNFSGQTAEVQRKRETDKAQEQQFNDLLKNGNTDEGRAALADFMTGLAGSLELARLEYERKLQQYQSEDSEGGASLSEDERADLDKMQAEINAGISRMNSYRDRIAGGQQQAQNQVKTLASFDAAAFSQMFGKKPARDENAERTAKATEDSEKHLKELLTKIGQLGWTGIS